MHRAAPVLAAVLALCGTACRSEAPSVPGNKALEPAPAATPASSPGAQFEGLGPHRRTVTTTSAEAQKYFDEGLAFLYGFNHDEAIRSFRRATVIDPGCAMADWGIAFAHGPHINNPEVSPERSAAAWKALENAQAQAASGTPVEQALIAALGARYAWPPPEDRVPLEVAFAEAMAAVWRAHPTDADVGALYAEALMNVHPWDLWHHDGTPQPWTPAIVDLLESVLRLDAKHPLALHLYIHAVEASADPGRADAVAATLRDLMPGVGHMVHMPTHIDVLRGRWEQAIDSNSRAIEADRAYLKVSPDQGFYRLYITHNQHMKAFAAMMVGRSAMALDSTRQMVASFPEDWLRENALWADGWVAMPLEVLMRFGRWQELLAEPEPVDYLPLSRALRHYARGVAYTALGEVESARAEQESFAAARRMVSEEARFGNNPAAALLGVAEALLEGEILYRTGKEKEGIERLEEAVRREDALVYDEPPDWIQPVRHALGAALLQSGEYGRAEAVFREDLRKLPGNGWSLYGLGRALRLQNKAAEAESYETQFAEAWKHADVRIKSACFCLSGV